MAESHNLRHKNSLRTKTEIQQELNQKLFEYGNAHANVMLLQKRITELTPIIDRLAKEQARPEKETDTKADETTEIPLAADTTVAEDAHVTQ